MSLPKIIIQYISDIVGSDIVNISPFSEADMHVKTIEDNSMYLGDWSFYEPFRIEENSVFPARKWLQPPPSEESMNELIECIKKSIINASPIGLANITMLIHRVDWTDKEISEIMKSVEPERWIVTLELISNSIAEFLDKDKKKDKEPLSLRRWHDLMMNTQSEIETNRFFYEIISRIALLADISLFDHSLDALPERLRAGLCVMYNFCPKGIEDILHIAKNNRYKGLIANMIITKSVPANHEIILGILSEEDWEFIGAQFVERILVLEKPGVSDKLYDDNENNKLVEMTEKALSEIILKQERDWDRMVRFIRWPECVEVLKVVDEEHTELLIDRFSDPLIKIMIEIWKTHRNNIIKRTLTKDFNNYSNSWFRDPIHMRSQLAINFLSLCLLTKWELNKINVKSILCWCQECLVSPKASFDAALFGGEIFLMLVVALEYAFEDQELCKKQSDIEQLAVNHLLPFLGYWEAHDKPWDGKVALSQNKNLFLIDWHTGELKKKNQARVLIEKWLGICTAKWPWMSSIEAD